MFYESNDLIIRPYRDGDEGSLAFYSNNKLIAAQMPAWFPSPFTYDDALVWIADNLQKNNNFAIIYYGDVIGNIGLRNIIGSEADGLTPVWRTAADRHILIPMLGKMDSLNASVSAAILLYEARRQRDCAE